MPIILKDTIKNQLDLKKGDLYIMIVILTESCKNQENLNGKI